MLNLRNVLYRDVCGGDAIFELMWIKRHSMFVLSMNTLYTVLSRFWYKDVNVEFQNYE
jgi:hypothetical protein